MKQLSVKIIRSSRRTTALELRPDLSVIIRVPWHVSDTEALDFFNKKRDWITKHIHKLQAQQLAPAPSLTAEELRQMAEHALAVFPKKVKYYADILQVTYGRITIRSQKTRWGSCSAKGNLNFNCLLMLAPDEVIDYVIVHELCHRLEMNHSPAFWSLVESVLPDYKTRQKWLKDYGKELIKRMEAEKSLS